MGSALPSILLALLLPGLSLAGEDLGKWPSVFDGRGVSFELVLPQALRPEPPFDPLLKTGAQLAKLHTRTRPGRLVFTVMGDSRPERHAGLKWVYPDNDVMEGFLSRIDREGSDFTFHLGDIVPTGKSEEYREILRSIGALKLQHPFLTTIGNHEAIAQGGRGNYAEAFGEEDYLYDYKGLRFIVLDSSRYFLSKEQMDWLKAALATPLRKIVFTHMPPHPLNGWTNNKFWREVAKKKHGTFRDDGTFTTLMREAGVERVYAGHIHGFGQADYKGVRYVLSGGAGSPLYPWYGVRYRFYHYLRVAAGEDGSLLEEVCRWNRGKETACRPAAGYPVFPGSHFGDERQPWGGPAAEEAFPPRP